MCMSTKYKQLFNWKTVNVNVVHGKDQAMIPMWKVVKSNNHGGGLISMVHTSFVWFPGWHEADITEYCSCSHEDTISEGIHCYLRRKDAEKALKNYRHHRENPFTHSVILKVFVDPQDVIGKGWSFSDRYGFKKGWWAHDYATLAQVRDVLKATTYATAVATKVYVTPKEYVKAVES